MPAVGTATPPPQAGNPALLHRFLGIGLVITGIVLIAVRRFAAVAESQDDQVLFEYVFSAIGVTMVGTALLHLKPQVPARRSGQTTAHYWADKQVTARATLVWFILDGGGIVAAVGHFLSGGPISAAVWMAAAAAFWMNGPRTFDQES